MENELGRQAKSPTKDKSPRKPGLVIRATLSPYLLRWHKEKNPNERKNANSQGPVEKMGKIKRDSTHEDLGKIVNIRCSE